MGEGKETMKKSSSVRSEKKKKRKKLFVWSKEEEVKLLKKLVEFSSEKMGHEELYPFLRNGSLGKVSKIQIFEKIQQLKKEYLEKELEYEGRMRHLELEEESFELSKLLWGELGETSKALDVWNESYFEGFFESHGLESKLFTPSFLHATKKDVDRLFCLQNHHFLIKSNFNAQLARLKCRILQTRFNNQ